MDWMEFVGLERVMLLEDFGIEMFDEEESGQVATVHEASSTTSL